MKGKKDRLENSGKAVDDAEYAYQMLMNFSLVYANVPQQLYQLTNNNFKYDAFNKALLSEYDRLKSEDPNQDIAIIMVAWSSKSE